MFPELTNLKIYLKPGATDMRKSINGLSLLVQEVMQNKVMSGDLYLFTNRKRNIIKALYWDRNGFCLWQKRLEQHKFPWSKSEEPCIELTEEEVKLLRKLRYAHKSKLCLSPLSTGRALCLVRSIPYL